MATRHGRSISATFGLALLAAVLALTPLATARADDADSLAAQLPHAFVGSFQWLDNARTQDVAIRFDTVRRVDAGHVEAVGCGTYDGMGRVTAIKVRMVVTLAGLQVEIWESEPDQADGFTTFGSHRGNLSGDLRAIDAIWTTVSTGERGHLRLQAAPAAQCAPTKPS